MTWQQEMMGAGDARHGPAGRNASPPAPQLQQLNIAAASFIPSDSSGGAHGLSTAALTRATTGKGKRASKPPRVVRPTMPPPVANKPGKAKARAVAGSGPATETEAEGAAAASKREPEPKANMARVANEALYEACVICAEPLTSAALGACGHLEVCALCSLRSRVLYNDCQCPLCKAELPQVVLAALRPDKTVFGVQQQKGEMATTTTVALFHLLALLPERSAAATSSSTPVGWGRQVYKDWNAASLVVAPTPSDRVHGRDAAAWAANTLKRQLEALTAVSCSVCASATGMAPKRLGKSLRDLRKLQQHAQIAHQRSLCKLCREFKKVFPSEQTLYTDEQLQAHDAQHPQCVFCQRRFYSNDELYVHLSRDHFACHVCERLGAQHQYFNDWPALEEHFHQEHFPCREAQCLEQRFTVFGTAMELERHQRDAHSHHMPRFGRNRARPANHLFAALPSVSAPFASTSATTTTSTRDVALRDGRSGRGGRTGASGMDRNGIRLDADGWQIFDDDLGTVREAEEVARRDGPIGGGAWGARGGDGMQEMFPALPTPAVPPRPQQLLPRAPPRINSAVLTATVTTKCLCGRRTKQIPMPAPGELPHAPLPCDPDCVRVARRQQLAAAFGQSDTGSCASAQAAAAFEPSLLRAALAMPQWVELVEEAMASLIESPSTRRQSLPPMPASQRQLVHELARHYNISTCSYGNEPKRHIDLFRVPNSVAPLVKLSQAARSARSVQPEEMSALVSEPSSAWALRFTELAPTVDVRRVLYAVPFDGRFEILPGPPPRRGAHQTAEHVTVQFSTEAAYRQVREALGGGVRGQYRVVDVSSPSPQQHLVSATVVSRQDDGWQQQSKAAIRRAGVLAEDAWDDEIKAGGGEVLVPPSQPLATANSWSLLEGQMDAGRSLGAHAPAHASRARQQNVMTNGDDALASELYPWLAQGHAEEAVPADTLHLPLLQSGGEGSSVVVPAAAMVNASEKKGGGDGCNAPAYEEELDEGDWEILAD